MKFDSSTQDRIRKAWATALEDDGAGLSAARNAAATLIQGEWRASAHRRQARNNSASVIQRRWQRWQRSNLGTHVIVQVRIRGEGDARRLEATPICAASPTPTENYSCPICLEDMTIRPGDPRRVQNRPSVWVGTFGGCNPLSASVAQQDPVAALQNAHGICAKCSLATLTLNDRPTCPLCRSPASMPGNTLHDALTAFYTPTPEGWPPTGTTSVPWREGRPAPEASNPVLAVPLEVLDAAAQRRLRSQELVMCLRVEATASLVGKVSTVGFALAGARYILKANDSPVVTLTLFALAVGSICVCGVSGRAARHIQRRYALGI